MTETRELPEIDKTPLQRLIEACDPEHRDIREIVWALYRKHRRLESVAEDLATLCKRNVNSGLVHRWATEQWGWRFDRVLIAPEFEDTSPSTPVAPA